MILVKSISNASSELIVFEAPKRRGIEIINVNNTPIGKPIFVKREGRNP